MDEADLTDLRTILRHSGVPSKREWWERYLKHQIEFWGVPTAEIRSVMAAWVDTVDPDPGEMRLAAWDLLRGPVAEEKLAALLLLQEHVLPLDELEPARDLPEIAAIFDEGSIWEWNTTDWLCVRVLGPLVQGRGGEAGRRIVGWTDAPGLWRRRCAIVAFVNLLPHPDVFPGMTDLVLEACAANVRDDARFAQTGVGWVLRELSRRSPSTVFDFVAEHKTYFGAESLRMATARLSDDQRRDLGVVGPRGRR